MTVRAANLVFIPKLVGVGFASGGNSAQEAGKLGIDVTRWPGAQRLGRSSTGEPTLSIRGMTYYRFTAVSPDGLCLALKRVMQRGVKILAQDSVQTGCRSYFISIKDLQRGASSTACFGRDIPLIQVDKKKLKSHAFFTIQPTVTDQNRVGEKAKESKGNPRNIPGWEIVTTQFGYNDAAKSLQTAEGIIQSVSPSGCHHRLTLTLCLLRHRRQRTINTTISRLLVLVRRM